MRLLIEGYHYQAADVMDVLKGLDFLENVNHEVVINYVGYLYNPHIHDCVFILPKVLIDKQGLVFEKFNPADIIHVDECALLDGADTEKRFIYEFAVWIYRALYVFNSHNPENDIVYHKHMAQLGNHQRHMTNTYLEVLLAMIDFNKNNQDFFMTIVKNMHSGLNKINWTRTISHSQAIVQGDSPIYLKPINKKRQINFDEELMIIFFSILKHINERYGFPVNINLGFELITGSKFEHYLNGFGKVRLRQIKYKYFSDKAVLLWDLCYAFFDRSEKVSVSSDLQEYLIAKNFNIVFEAIIDELIGDPRETIPSGLKDQPDGKRVDHIYLDKGLNSTSVDDKSIYYIGDSKYYQLNNNISDESVYKQYTYARNVIQWNMNLFLDNQDYSKCYRDEETEGYNIVPNFFISARMDSNLSYSDDIYETDRDNKTFISRHFENRLFDRDTLLISHYDVNFLFIVSLYAKDNDYSKAQWKSKVRKLFRENIQDMLQSKFEFYAMSAKPGVDATEYIKENFQSVLGKLYKPYTNPNYFSLALDKNDKYIAENESLLSELRKHFYVTVVSMGDEPEQAISEYAAADSTKPEQWSKTIDGKTLIGCVRNADHLSWINETHRYNIRLMSHRDRYDGGIIPSMEFASINKIVLYSLDNENRPVRIEKSFKVVEGSFPLTMTKEEINTESLALIGQKYPSSHNPFDFTKKYFVYELEEEEISCPISFEQLQVLLNDVAIPGTPIVV